ncbi:MAG: FAD-dependent oxidoreductase [Gammaproteobacteria bacterium]|nr:FAD-dependent oxidoreductase [Gammaproteobacteria bacterium]
MKIIVGGGISGLWLAAELKARNIPCCVIEKNALGQAQTLASQGMIHGGTKYALDGRLSKAANEIGAMPARWKQALKGNGKVDLRAVQLEREDQLLWSVGSVGANLMGFFASKAMRSRIERIDPRTEAAFNYPGFKGHLYRLSEPVLRLDTLVEAFAELLDGQLFHAEVTGFLTQNGSVVGVETSAGQMPGDVIMTAGEGTEPLLSTLNGQRPQMQLRPLAMGVCKLARPIPRVFGHQLGGGSKPKLSVSTHEFEGAQYLYLGGQLAEDGVHLDDDNLRHRAVCAVSEALRWLEPTIETTRIFRVNRAEPSTNEGNRPDTAFVAKRNNLIVTWPIKLALAPALADQILPMLKITPDSSRQPQWPVAPQGTYPWA